MYLICSKGATGHLPSNKMVFQARINYPSNLMEGLPEEISAVELNKRLSLSGH